MNNPEIKGYIGIYLTPEGRVFSAVNDFSLSRPGGFILAEAQKIRVKRALALDVVNGYSPALAEAMDEHDYDKLLRRLPGKKVYIPIGYEGLAREEE